MRVSVLGLAVVVAAGCGGSRTLTEQTLRKQNETVRSAAAEGALLAQDAAAGRTTEPFVRIHAEKLAEQAGKAAETLRSAKPEARLETARRRALAEAADVERALENLHAEPDDRDVARRVERELEAVSQ
jgi:hypothetical protein